MDVRHPGNSVSCFSFLFTTVIVIIIYYYYYCYNSPGWHVIVDIFSFEYKTLLFLKEETYTRFSIYKCIHTVLLRYRSGACTCGWIYLYIFVAVFVAIYSV